MKTWGAQILCCLFGLGFYIRPDYVVDTGIDLTTLLTLTRMWEFQAPTMVPEDPCLFVCLFVCPPPHPIQVIKFKNFFEREQRGMCRTVGREERKREMM